jgi:hypothetical protein
MFLFIPVKDRSLLSPLVFGFGDAYEEAEPSRLVSGRERHAIGLPHRDLDGANRHAP